MRRLNFHGGLNALSIGAAAWFTWLHVFTPLLGTESLWILLRRVLTYAAFAVVASAATAACAYLVLSRAGIDGPIRRPWRSVWAATWYAPAVILATSLTWAAAAASLLLIVCTTSALAVEWTSSGTVRPKGFTPPGVLAWRAAISIAISVAAHGALFAFGGNSPLLAAALFTGTAAVITALAIAVGAFARFQSVRKVPTAALGALLTLILATAISIVHYSQWNGDSEEANGTQEDGPGGDLKGVILLSNTAPRQPLVAPKSIPDPRRRTRSNLTIPFSGEYWIYRFPFQEPPAGSLRRLGNPLELSFSTPDHASLFLKAQQMLEAPMEADCCSHLRIALRSLNVHPGSLRAQPVLMDSKTALGSRQYLAPIEVAEGDQTLEFKFPGDILLKQFDQIRVEFLSPPQMRLFRSPKIEIQTFTLVARIL
ncbi:MAG: hypothetical protein ABI811_07020 [Acidobacteriota bacterium]